MNKLEKIRVATIILIALTFAITFSLYRKDAQTQEVSISFGEIISLQVGGDEITEKIEPENAETTVNVTLETKKINNDTTADAYTYGKFYVEIVQISEAEYKLADQITVSLSAGGKTYSHEKIVKSGEAVPIGFVAKLTEDPISVKLTYSLTDEAKNNFIRYAEQQVQLILHWDFCEAPTVIVNVLNPTLGNGITVYCEVTDSLGATETKTLSFSSSEGWKSFTISPSTTKIRFSKNDESFNEPLDVDFNGLKFTDSSKAVSLEDMSEIWITLSEVPKVYASEPSEN